MTEEHGQALYDAFRTRYFGVSPLTGRPLPPWEELSNAHREVLNGAVDEIIEALA